MTVIKNITAKYTSLDSWIYDRFIAPGVCKGFLEKFDCSDNATYKRLPPGATMLDIGCGGGQVALAIAKRYPSLVITGVDLSPQQIARANQRKSVTSNVSFTTGDALNLNFTDQSFNTTLSVACLKHWPNKTLGLQECWRVLKEGGVANIIEVNRDISESDLKNFVALWRIPKFLRPYGEKFFRKFVAERSVSIGEVEEMLKECSFSSFSIRHIDSSPAFHLMAMR